MKLYHQSRTCGKCSHEESRELPSLNAAFEERRVWNEPCQKCSSKSFSSLGCEIPVLDARILEEWSGDQKLTILEQDEDIMMADADSFDLLCEFVQRRDILKSKRVVLLSALCILIYDNTTDDVQADPECNPETAASAANFLTANSWLFDEIDDALLYDYIKADVYPLINRQLPNAT